MRRLVYLRDARTDLVDIQDYIARTSGSAAVGVRFVATLRQQCQKLAALPGTLGRPRPEIRSDVRSFAFRNYVIFFRYTGHTLEVIDVLEGHRDIVTFFQDDEA